jgi:hypothetical protein
MSRWKLKGCPRCRGDIYVEKEDNNWHEQCLQCGYVHYRPIASKTVHYDGQWNGPERPVKAGRTAATVGN